MYEKNMSMLQTDIYFNSYKISLKPDLTFKNQKNGI